MSNLLILPERHTTNDALIWKEAINRGWNTYRAAIGETVIEDRERVLYYGNTLHAASLKTHVTFKAIDPYWMERCPELLGRKVRVSHVAAESPVKRRAFIKPIGEKYFPAKVYEAGEELGAAAAPEDLCYVSDVVDFIDEVRCFVLDREIKTASYYKQQRAFEPEHVPSDTLLFDVLRHKIDALCFQIGDALPSGVVVDYGRVGDNWFIVEANEAWASGIYDNDPAAVFDVLLESQDYKPCQLSAP